MGEPFQNRSPLLGDELLRLYVFCPHSGFTVLNGRIKKLSATLDFPIKTESFDAVIHDARKDAQGAESASRLYVMAAVSW